MRGDVDAAIGKTAEFRVAGFLDREGSGVGLGGIAFIGGAGADAGGTQGLHLAENNINAIMIDLCYWSALQLGLSYWVVMGVEASRDSSS